MAEREEWADRFRDEGEEPLPAYYGCCGACGEFTGCAIEGHELVGWCRANGDFQLATDPDECD